MNELWILFWFVLGGIVGILIYCKLLYNHFDKKFREGKWW